MYFQYNLSVSWNSIEPQLMQMKEGIKEEILKPIDVQEWPVGGMRVSPSQLSEATNADDALISGFQPPELWKNEFLLFKPSS